MPRLRSIPTGPLTGAHAIPLALLLATAGSPLAAPTGLGFGFHGGYGESKDAKSGSAVAGIQLEIRPAPWLGFVGSMGYKFDEDFLIQPLGEDPLEFNAHSLPATALARIYVPLEGISPYFTAGAQLRFISYDYGDLEDAFDNFEADDSETAFGWIVGGGAEVFPSPKVSFFGEARFEFVDADRDLGEAELDQVEEFDYDQWSLVGGVTFYFGSAER